MKHLLQVAALWLLLLTLVSQLATAHAQGTAFTYQGRVLDNGTNFTGTVTASIFNGSGASLASLSAANLSPAHHFTAGYANLPISFEANIGQADAAVKFLAHGSSGDFLLTRSEAWLTVQKRGEENGPRLLRLRLAGANADSELEGLDPLAGKANYILGNDSSRWHTDVPTFARVKYHEVYPGVDLIYYGNQQKLEYDFIVRPGASPNAIALEFAGADKISLDAEGDLLLYAGGNPVRQHKPVVYQEINGARKMLAGNYVLHSAMQAGFQVADYDKTVPLIIDPVLAYSATFGGSGLNQALAIALDTNDNVYVTGNTTSSDFPLVNPYQSNYLGNLDVFVMKFDTNGAVVYSTYLGGGLLNNINQGSSGQSIAVDVNGDAFVAGYTQVTNFPVINALQTTNRGSADAFVTELNPAGNALVFSTYLGGKGVDAANGVALNTNGDVIITGFTQSTNFPTANPAQPVYGGNGDAFIAKLSAGGGALLYSTYLGGSNYDNIKSFSSKPGDSGGAVAVDFDGNAYVTGWTYSTNFPVLNAFQPTNATSFYGLYSAAFVTKFDPAGNLVYSTYFAGQRGDFGRAIGVDFGGNVYFAGNDLTGTLPTTNAFQASFGGASGAQTGDGFVAAFDSTGTNLIYSTYLGGSGDDQVNGIAVRPEDGAVAVTGFTDSPNFPLLNAVQPTGNQGFFISANGATTWNLSNAGLASGIIYAIQVDPSNPSVVYALTKNGFFKSTDGGVDWTSAGNGLGIFLTSSYGLSSPLLALNPLHPGTLYIGGYSGIFKTTNGAANWTTFNSGLPGNPWIQAVAVDPATPTTLYVGTQANGVYKSIDGGNSWNVATNGLNNLNVGVLLVDPQNSTNIYAGVDNSSGTSLFKSSNGGGNWTLLGGGLAAGPVVTLAANASTIYSVVGNVNESATLYSSTNGGANWAQLLQAQGLNFTALAIAPPSVPALTIAGSGNNDIVSWPASFNGYTLQFTPSLNPTNWQNVAQFPALNNGNDVVTNPMSGAQGYYRLISTNNTPSPPTLYLGTDSASGQGVLKSTDGGVNWNAIGFAGNTINVLAVNPAIPAMVYAGLNGGRDGFVSTLTPSGQLYSSTYSGGSGTDQGNAIATDFTDVFVAGSTASSDFPTTTVPKSIMQKSKVIENDVKRVIPAIKISVGGINTGKSTVQHQFSYYNCPTNIVETWVLFAGGATVNRHIGVYNWGTVRVQITGSAPGGLHIGSYHIDHDYYTIGYVDLSGVTTNTASTNIVTIIFTERDCTWSKTVTIIVKVVGQAQIMSGKVDLGMNAGFESASYKPRLRPFRTDSLSALTQYGDHLASAWTFLANFTGDGSYWQAPPLSPLVAQRSYRVSNP
jgi:hypothetical protein